MIEKCNAEIEISSQSLMLGHSNGMEGSRSDGYVWMSMLPYVQSVLYFEASSGGRQTQVMRYQSIY